MSVVSDTTVPRVDSRPWIVLVGAGKWQVHGVLEARELGYRTLAMDGEPNAPGLGMADDAAVVDISKAEKVIDHLVSTHIEPMGVVSICSEAGMMTAATVRERFSLPGPDCGVTLGLTNKAVQRSLLSKGGVPAPGWTTVDRKSYTDSLEKIRHQVGYPCVVKPLDKAGSRGVSYVANEEELYPAIEYAVDIGGGDTVIVEEYLDGTEYTVETYTKAGTTEILAITEKSKLPGSWTVSGQLATAQLNNDEQQIVTTTIQQAFKALNYMEGPGHTEVILSKDGRLGVVEVAGRGGGYMVCERFVPAVSGFNVTRATIQSAMGVDAKEKIFRNRAAVLRFFPSTKGKIYAFSGFEVASKMEGVEASSFVRVGDTVGDACSDGDRLGYILSMGDTLKEAVNLADKAEDVIHFSVSE